MQVLVLVKEPIQFGDAAVPASPGTSSGIGMSILIRLKSAPGWRRFSLSRFGPRTPLLKYSGIAAASSVRNSKKFRYPTASGALFDLSLFLLSFHDAVSPKLSFALICSG